MFGFKERRLARRAQEQAQELEVRHQAWIAHEKSWWEFQLDMDFLHSKISEDEMRDWRVRIRNGEEYTGWALRKERNND